MTVVAFIDRNPSSDSTLRHAAWGARTLGQQLVLATLIDGGDDESALIYEAYGGMDAREDLYRDLLPIERAGNDERETAAIEMVQSTARRARELGVERVRTTVSREPLSSFVEHITGSGDLLVFSRIDGRGDQQNRLMDEILHIRNRVMLLAPDSFVEPKSWLMALDGGPSSGRAVEYLTENPLLRSAPGTAAIVGPDHQQRIHFRDAVKHLQSAGYRITAHELQGGADDVLLAIMQVMPVDLLVMGAYGQGKFRSMFERSTTSRLLGAFKGPVLIART